ncbi:hypothetical protein [Segatella baroniae]|uniref:hypothetical protein n=1 Tax=Segatella baroniae TaxID=305719 RepID=UPI0028ED7893|nr:hypothetical protein [Segatella baroniae]
MRPGCDDSRASFVSLCLSTPSPSRFQSCLDKAEELQYVPLPVNGQIDRITIEAGYGYRGFAELFFYQ